MDFGPGQWPPRDTGMGAPGEPQTVAMATTIRGPWMLPSVAPLELTLKGFSGGIVKAPASGVRSWVARRSRDGRGH